MKFCLYLLANGNKYYWTGDEYVKDQHAARGYEDVKTLLSARDYVERETRYRMKIQLKEDTRMDKTVNDIVDLLNRNDGMRRAWETMDLFSQHLLMTDIKNILLRDFDEKGS